MVTYSEAGWGARLSLKASDGLGDITKALILVACPGILAVLTVATLLSSMHQAALHMASFAVGLGRQGYLASSLSYSARPGLARTSAPGGGPLFLHLCVR